MDDPDRERDFSRDTHLAIALAVTVGLPIFIFFNIITGGLFLLLAFIAGGMALLGLLNYLIWGKTFSNQVVAELGAWVASRYHPQAA